MSSLTIRHITTYRYRCPVAFGEHRMMLRPRDSRDQTVVAARLEIRPEPASLHDAQDAFGNHVTIARFDTHATELSFESIVSLKQCPSSAASVDPQKDAGTPAERADCLRRLHDHSPDEIGRWARQFLPTEALGPLASFTRLSQAIHEGFVYRRREAKGIQSPAETLRLGQGTCRDFALLMVEAARALGFAARFASGYLAVVDTKLGDTKLGDAKPGDAEPGDAAVVSSPDGATHAWAQVWLPGTGWVDFDPTSGNVGTASLIAVAVVSDPYDALPLHGTYAGAASDFLGMEVRVSVTPGGG